jgi:hypothetical protein
MSAILRQNPELTTEQVLAKLGTDYPVGQVRAMAVMKICREIAARDSWAQQRNRWPIDRFTMIRIRISRIWKHHPDYSAKHVIRILRSKHHLRVPWVQRILGACWRTSAEHSGEELRIGRRVYDSRIQFRRNRPSR